MKKYKVSGICLVPAEATIMVMAESADEATAKAHAQFKASPCDYVTMTDEQSAHDWHTETEEV